MDVVNAEQVTFSLAACPWVRLTDIHRLASQKKQVPVPLWHSNVFPPTSERKGASPEW